MVTPKPRLLLIEDDVALAESTRELLDVMGYEVHWADSLEMAYREIAHDGYKVALLDLNLGKERGEDLVLSLRAAGHHVPPIIIVSAQPYDALQHAAKVVGAAAILQKPSSGKALKDTIARVIEAAA